MSEHYMMEYPNTLAMLVPEPVLLVGTITTDSNGVVTSTQLNHRGFTLAKTDTGEYTLTLSRAYPEIFGFYWTKIGSTAYDGNWQVRVASPTTASITLFFEIGGVASAFNSKSAYFALLLTNAKAGL